MIPGHIADATRKAMLSTQDVWMAVDRLLEDDPYNEDLRRLRDSMYAAWSVLLKASDRVRGAA